MKKTVFFLFLLAATGTYAQKAILSDSADSYFQEIKTNTSHFKDLWNLDLYGPILLVDPSTRKTYSNYADSAGILKPEGKSFSGILPDKINVANTSIRWNGRYWAMIMLPIPSERKERLDLLSHELFHRSQSDLGFHIINSDNNHLDQRDGRVYLRMELEALQQAFNSGTKQECDGHLADAMFFRQTRYNLFPGASESENLLELNEGLAAYTGIVMSGRNKEELRKYFEQKLQEFQDYPTFVRSFAYFTIPLYGCILNHSNKYWNRTIGDTTNLTEFFLKAFGLKVPVNICPDCMSQYGYNTILDQEVKREAEKEARLTAFRNTFIEKPHLVINLKKMSVSFDPRNIVPLDGFGTVYPTMRISDIWGILTVTEGALLGKNWDRVTVGEPKLITQDSVIGNGWIIHLNKGYRVAKNDSDGDYSLSANEKE